MRCASRSSLLLLSTWLAACPRPAPHDAPAPASSPRGTAAPAAAAPRLVRGRYDPGADPRNAGGWDFRRRRSATDPADRAKQPFSIAALYQLRGVADPQWSPDGKRLLLVVTRHDLAAGKSNRDIYRVDADGSDLRRMTRHAAADYAPRWSPDGRSVIFISTRAKDQPQLWRMPADGGEAEQLTRLSTGVESAAWAPDGASIALSSRVFPEHGADDARNKALLQDIDKSPVKAHVADELLFRHWTFYKDGRRRHVLRLILASKKIVDLTPGDHDSPAFSHGDTGFVFSPDSRELCFVSNRSRASERAWTTNKDLWVVPLTGGPPRNLTAANRAFDGHPAYSPDGAQIAFLRQAQPGYESDRPRLAVYDRASGEVRVLTAGFDNWVIDFRWAPDSRSLLFKAAVKGRFPLFRVDLASGAITKLAPPSVRDFAVARDGRVAFTFTAVDRPLELFVGDADGSAARRLTGFNDAVVKRFDLRPAEELWLPGADGKPVHTFVVKPHGFAPGRRYPLVINVHGGPQYQWDDRLRGDWQVYPGAGYVVAFFNPHGSIGYGQAYTAAISKDWGGKVYKDILAVTEGLARQPYVDPQRIGAMGWSYGGYMMAWMLGHTRRFKAYAAMMPIYDLPYFYGATEELWFPEWDLGGPPWKARAAYRKWSPSTYADRFATPTLVITGEKDYRAPYTQSLQLFTALRRRGVPARLIVFRDDGHWPSWVRSMPLYFAAHLDWFHRYLGGAPSPYDVQQLVRGRAFKAARDAGRR